MPAVDIFWRTYNRDPARQTRPENVRWIRLELAADLGLPEILTAAIRAGVSKGSSASGIFEVQTDAGIWDRPDGGKLDPPRRARFRTWDEAEC
jgi:hypothetical protein